MNEKITKSKEEWKEQLTEEQYSVCRCKGTEPPFANAFYNVKSPGTYSCVCCGNELFSSDTKYDSGTGWPSFWAPMTEHSVSTARDTSGGRERTEVLCLKCDSHLGHVFDDGPAPTHQRYCINSASLVFHATDQSVAK